MVHLNLLPISHSFSFSHTHFWNRFGWFHRQKCGRPDRKTMKHCSLPSPSTFHPSILPPHTLCNLQNGILIKKWIFLLHDCEAVADNWEQATWNPMVCPLTSAVPQSFKSSWFDLVSASVLFDWPTRSSVFEPGCKGTCLLIAQNEIGDILNPSLEILKSSQTPGSWF